MAAACISSAACTIDAGSLAGEERVRLSDGGTGIPTFGQEATNDFARVTVKH
jgi:hypothetical protein